IVRNKEHEVLELSDSEEEMQNLDSEGDQEEETFSDGDDEMEYDNMNVRDVTKKEKSKRKQVDSVKKAKIVESDFEDVELARLAKSSVRLAICISDMWPRKTKPSLSLLKSELKKMGNKDRLESLKKITTSTDPTEVPKLLKFMNYASPMVRLDIAEPVRLLVGQFYELSGAKGHKGQEEVVECFLSLLRVIVLNTIVGGSSEVVDASEKVSSESGPRGSYFRRRAFLLSVDWKDIEGLLRGFSFSSR
ncbi:hypothetical protein F5878DRAFT_648068, partial [Lentinula raphanica]